MDNTNDFLLIISLNLTHFIIYFKQSIRCFLITISIQIDYNKFAK